MKLQINNTGIWSDLAKCHNINLNTHIDLEFNALALPLPWVVADALGLPKGIYALDDMSAQSILINLLDASGMPIAQIMELY